MCCSFVCSHVAAVRLKYFNFYLLIAFINLELYSQLHCTIKRIYHIFSFVYSLQLFYNYFPISLDCLGEIYILSCVKRIKVTNVLGFINLYVSENQILKYITIKY